MTVSDVQATELLEQMLSVPSFTGREDQLAALLRDGMIDFGFQAELDTMGNVIGRISPTGATREVVVLGHMDTVPGVVPVERRDDALYGRGAVDAKGPLATAIVAAARAAPHAGVRITVIGAVQEEGPSVGARHVAKREAPDYLVIAEPSGWDALVLGYKGSQRFTVEISCSCSHSAGPESTACERAFAFWHELVAWCARYSGEVVRHESASTTFQSLTPSLLQMYSTNDGLSETACLQIGLRLPPGASPETLKDEIRALLPEGKFSFSRGEPAVRGSKHNPLVASFLRAVRSEGAAPRFKVKTGTSDMNVVGPVWNCPMLAYGPGDSRLDHTPNEHISIEEYLRAIRVLTRALGGL